MKFAQFTSSFFLIDLDPIQGPKTGPTGPSTTPVVGLIPGSSLTDLPNDESYYKSFYKPRPRVPSPGSTCMYSRDGGPNGGVASSDNFLYRTCPIHGIPSWKLLPSPPVSHLSSLSAPSFSSYGATVSSVPPINVLYCLSLRTYMGFYGLFHSRNLIGDAIVLPSSSDGRVLTSQLL